MTLGYSEAATGAGWPAGLPMPLRTWDLFDDFGGMAGSGRMSARAILACGGDPAADRWTIALWCATAELLFCRYHYTEDGAYDGGGRWRRRSILHHLVGLPVHHARATAMAEHFCGVTRQAAKAYARGRPDPAHVRRSFESAFAERLVARLRDALAAARRTAEGKAAHAAEAEANDRLLRFSGIERPNRLGAHDVSGRDRAAVRDARAAAENISLVLRSGYVVTGARQAARDQMHFPF